MTKRERITALRSQIYKVNRFQLLRVRLVIDGLALLLSSTMSVLERLYITDNAGYGSMGVSQKLNK